MFARNQKVSAALGLVSKHDAFVQSTRDDLARIPELEKQAKTVRGLNIEISKKLGSAELRIAELQDELSATMKTAAAEKDALAKQLSAAERIAERVPGLETKVAALTAELEESMNLAATRQHLVEERDGQITQLDEEKARAKEESDQAIANQDTKIKCLEAALLQSTERGLMMAEGEVRFYQEERVPALQAALSGLEADLSLKIDECRLQFEDLEETRLQLALATRRGDVLSGQLIETQADLAEALKPPITSSVGIQVQAMTKEFGDTFQWSKEDKPKKDQVVLLVSKSISTLCDLPADHPQIVRQQTASCGSHAHVQATVDMVDNDSHCVLKTIREEELETELEECEDALEKCENMLAVTKKELESTRVRLTLAELENETNVEERDDALAMLEEIEEVTSQRLNKEWKAKLAVQGIVYKFAMNTQQKLTTHLASLLNKMKVKVGMQTAFLGALKEGSTNRAKSAEERRTNHTPDQSTASTPNQSRPNSARPVTPLLQQVAAQEPGKVDIMVVDRSGADEASTGGDDTIGPLEAEAQNEFNDAGEAAEDDLKLSGFQGDTSTVDEDAANIQRFESVLQAKIDDLATRSKEADQEVAQLRFLLRVKTTELKSRSMKLLKVESRLSQTIDSLHDEQGARAAVERKLEAANKRITYLQEEVSLRIGERDSARQESEMRLTIIQQRDGSIKQRDDNIEQLKAVYDALAMQRLSELEKLNAALTTAAGKIDELTEERRLLEADKALLQKCVSDSYRTHTQELKRVFLRNLKATRTVGTQLDCCVCAMRSATNDSTLLPKQPDNERWASRKKKTVPRVQIVKDRTRNRFTFQAKVRVHTGLSPLLQ